MPLFEPLGLFINVATVCVSAFEIDPYLSIVDVVNVCVPHDSIVFPSLSSFSCFLLVELF